MLCCNFIKLGYYQKENYFQKYLHLPWRKQLIGNEKLYFK